MPVSFPVDQGTPFISGMKALTDIYEMISQRNYRDSQTKNQNIANQYAPQTLAAKLQEMQLANQYYPKMKEAELAETYQGKIPNYQGMANYHNAGAGHLNAGTKHQQMINMLENEKVKNIMQQIHAVNNGQQQMPQQVVGVMQNKGQMPNQDKAQRIGDILGNTSEVGISKEEIAERNRERLFDHKEELKKYNKGLDEAKALHDNSKKIEMTAGNFHRGYSQSDWKGSLTGKLPVNGLMTAFANVSNEQQAEQASNELQGMSAKEFGGSRVTNTELNFFKNVKLNRALEPEFEKKLYGYIDLKSKRAMEKHKFLNEAKKNGIPYDEAQDAWDSYDENRPIINLQTGELLKHNLNKGQEYLNKFNREERQSLNKMEDQDIEQEKYENGKRFVKIGGQWGHAE